MANSARTWRGGPGDDAREAVRERLSCEEAFRKLGVELREAGADTWMARCPFHTERTPSCAVHREYWHCFGCGVGGDVFEFVMRREGVEFPAALELCAGWVGVELRQWTPEERERVQAAAATRRQGLELLAAAQAWFRACYVGEVGAEARAYAEGRGVTAELAERFGVGYAPDAWDGLRRAAQEGGRQPEDLVAVGLVGVSEGRSAQDGYCRFRDRLMFAVRDGAGRVVGFSGRTLKADDAKVPKYLNSAESAWFKKGELVYGLHEAREEIRSRGRAVVVEGQMDVLGCAGAGVLEAVAPLGTALGPEQAQQLRRVTELVVLGLDADEAGQAATERTVGVLRAAGLRVVVASWAPAKDAHELWRQAGAEAVQAAVLGAERWERWLARRKLWGKTGEAAAAAVAAYLLEAWKLAGEDNELSLDAAVDEAAEATGLPRGTLRRQLRSVRRNGGKRPAQGKAGRPKNDYAELADAFAGERQVDGVLRYRFWRDAWRWYDGQQWVAVAEADVEGDVVGWLRANRKEMAERRAVQNLMLNLRSTDLGLVASRVQTPCWLDGEWTPAGERLAFRNGSLDWAAARDCWDGEELVAGADAWRGPDPRLFVRNTLPYDFDGAAPCELWRRYLERVQPVAADREVLRMLCGLMLVPDTRFNAFWLLVGEAGTGKSVFLHVLERLVGLHNVCSVPLGKFADDHYTYQLCENLLNSIDDMGLVGVRDAEGTIKIAADGRTLDIRRLYEDGTHAPVTARTVAACNHLPRFAERSDAIWDRLRVLPFQQRIRDTEEQDSRLRQKLESELPGICVWALKGLHALQGLEQFPEHSAGAANKAAHRNDCDPDGTWLQEYLVAAPECRVESAEVYKRYRAWAEDNGYQPISAGTLNKSVERIYGLGKKSYRDGARFCKGWVGLGFRGLEADA